MRKTALIVGLNYPGTEYALSGCVLDAEAIGERLMRAGYEVQGLVQSATPGEVADTLRWAANTHGTHDSFYFTYSGHGTQIPGNEADGSREALCLWDRPNGIMLLRDSDLLQMLHAIPGNVFMLLDSCYSAGMERQVTTPGEQTDLRKKSIPLSPTMQIFDPGDRRAAKKPAITRQYHLFACAENEVSYDTAGGGVFTTSLMYHSGVGRRSIGRAMLYTVNSCMGMQTPEYKITGGTSAKRLFV